MKIKTREIEGYLIFDLEEDISLDNTSDLEHEIYHGQGGDFSKVVLNIRKVDYINSFALGVLIKIMDSVEKSGKEFFLMNASENVQTLLRVTGVLDKFKFFEG